MSIPARFNVLTDDLEIFNDQSWFTFSHDIDISDRQIWLEAFKAMFREFNNHPELKPEWADNFYAIQVNNKYNFTFYNTDFEKV